MLEALLLLVLAKVDNTQIATATGIILALVALVRAFTIDPRAARLAERKENQELRREVDSLYEGKRAAEDREREVRRRLDKAERELEQAQTRITRLTGDLDGARAQIERLQADVRKWRLIAGESRGWGELDPGDS